MEDPIIVSGRPMRKGAGKRESNPDFVDPVAAIKDPIGDLVEENKALLQSTRRKCKKRKRVRSPSPSPPPFSPVECLTEGDLNSIENSPSPELAEAPESYSPQINLTFNIPLGFSGPFKIQFSPSQLQEATKKATVHSVRPAASSTIAKKRKIDSPSETTSAPAAPPTPPKSKTFKLWVKKYGKPPAGFLDLPPELRNVIYRMIFVAPGEIAFTNNANILSSAFLRTCKQIHAEASSILYGENKFVFKRNRNIRSPFWISDAKEVGYFDMRHFLHMIGQPGRKNLRRIHIVLEDASNRHSYGGENHGRFCHDGNLFACFKLLSKECMLKNLALTFNGRRQVNSFDVRFIETLCAIEVDNLVINPDQLWTGDKIDHRAQDTLKDEMVRIEPLYEKSKTPKGSKAAKFLGSRSPLPW